jgi:hypothetical protein
VKKIKRKKIMNDKSTSDKLAAIVVALLLILTAWGNATVMLIISILGLILLLIFRQNITRGGTLAAAVGFVLSVGIALATLFC